ncbi:MAG: hypothetical protein N4A74_25605 [Carboxylicivirga sp.]|jgi:uncharacterized protein YerC|nr:hypothetical protein [Carboxylicivirga sp.]
MERNIRFQLTDQESQELIGALDTLERILEPKLVSLSIDDRKELSKMGDKTTSFVEKALEYGKAYPQYMPDFIKTDEMEIDFEAVKTLRKLNTPIERIYNMINDTSTIAGSEALHSGLSIYKIMKNAAAMDQPGAKEAAKELSNRFPRGKRKTKDPETAESDNE